MEHVTLMKVTVCLQEIWSYESVTKNATFAYDKRRVKRTNVKKL